MKRRILALILALVMAVGLALPVSAEGLDGATTFGGDGAPVVITGDGVTTPPPADTPTPTTGDSTTTPPTTTPPAAPVDDEDESDTPAPLAMASPMSVGATPTTTSVQYVDENGDTKTVTATKVEGGSTTGTTALTGGATAETAAWCYVEDSETISGTLEITGHVNLILCDGANLTVNGGIKIGWGNASGGTSNKGASLTIYGQTNQTGKLTANAESDSGGINVFCSSLTVNGGVIEATGRTSGNESNGIYIAGSLSDSTLSSMTVNSGKVTAKGGGSNEADSSGIRLHNGTLTVTINGGEVTAIGGASTGTTGYSYGINNGGGTVTITGGKVIAKRASSGSISKAVSGTTLALPTTYWWRTDSAATTYKTQNKYTDSALEGEYFELTTTQQTVAENDKDEIVPYVDASGGSKNCKDYIVLRNSSGDVTLTDGWYVVNSDVTIGGTLTINGKVHLILCDDAMLTVNKGVKVDGETENSGSLTIYGQDGQTGKLVASGTANVNGGFGISSPGYGALTINGGIIEATGANDSRSTDGAEEDAMKGVVNQSFGIHAMYLVINGGKVTAKGGKAVGVPTGSDGNAYSYGINVTGTMTVTGGKVTATGGEATGDGSVVMSCGINASEMTVTGGEIEATGGEANNTTDASATSVGIYTGNVTIGGSGKVTATGGEAVADKGSATSNGIEAGSMTVGSVPVAYAVGDDTPATTTGAVVNATGGTAEDTSGGIVVERGNISISSGTVTATGGVAGRSVGVVSGNEISVAGDATLTATGGSTEDLTVEESYGIVGVRLQMGDLETSGNAEVTATGGTATKSCGIEVIDMGERNDTPMVLLNGGKLTAIGADYGINVMNWGVSAAAYALDDGSTEDTGASQGMVTIMKGTLIADATGTGHGLDLDKGNGESYSLVCPAAYWWRINKAVNGYKQFPGNAYVHNNLNDYVEITTEGEGLPLLPGGETHKHTRRQNTAVAAPIPTAPDKVDVTSPETFDAGIAVYAVMGVMSATTSAAWIGRRRK